MYTSSGTARIFELPLRKTTKTFLAPHRKADVAQSNAVSPAPRTITFPCNDGSWGAADALQAHIPGNKIWNTKSRNEKVSMLLPGLLPSATLGKKFFDVKNPLFSVRPLKIGFKVGCGKPMPRNMASDPEFKRF